MKPNYILLFLLMVFYISEYQSQTIQPLNLTNFNETTVDITANSNVAYLSANETFVVTNSTDEILLDNSLNIINSRQWLNASEKARVILIQGSISVLCALPYIRSCTNLNVTRGVLNNDSNIAIVASGYDSATVAFTTNKHVFISETVTAERLKKAISGFIASLDISTLVLGTYHPSLELDDDTKSTLLTNYFPKTAFKYEQYAFIIANHYESDDNLVAKISRIHEDDANCYIDMLLQCGNTPPESQTLIQATVLESSEDSSNMSAVALFHDNGGGPPYVCTYTISDIMEHFNETQRREKCAGKGDYVDDKPGLHFNASCSTDYSCTSYTDVDKCSSPKCKIITGRLTYPLNGTKHILNNVDDSINITSIAAVAVNHPKIQFVLYLATQNGSVFRGYETNKKIKGFIKMEFNDKIKQIQYLVSTNDLLVVSENKISKIQEGLCSKQNVTWEQCLSLTWAVCGWCLTEQRCTLQSNCSQKASWLPSITGVAPYRHTVGISKSTEYIQFNKTIDWIPASSDLNLKCIYKDKEIEAEYNNGNDNAFNFKCDIKNLTDLYNRDNYDVAKISLWSSEYQAPIQTIALFNCSARQDGNSCLKAHFYCGWCQCSLQCLPHQESCPNGEIMIKDKQNYNLIVLEEQLQVHPGTNVEVEIKLKVKNESNFNNFTCIRELNTAGLIGCKFEPGIDVKATIKDDTFFCSSYSFRDVGDYRVYPTYNGMKITETSVPIEVNVTCSQITDCYYCSVASQFGCVWSNDTGQCSKCDDNGSANNCSKTDNGCSGKKFEDIKSEKLSFPKGPKSGGTRLKIAGSGFDADNQEAVKVWIGNYSQCQIVTFTKDMIECITTSGDDFNLDLVLIYGGLKQVPLNKTFSYLPDPTVEHILPKGTFQSGGANLTVIGTGFDIIQQPEIGVIGKPDSFKPCEQHPRNNTHIFCPAPSYNKNNLKKRKKRSEVEDINLTVKMDGVMEMSAMKYYKDPQVFVFDDESSIKKFTKDDHYLSIKGERLNETARLTDYMIYIGNTMCDVGVKGFSATEIRCYPPKKEPSKRNATSVYPEVEVKVGNYRRRVGFLMYVLETNSSSDYIIIISVLAVVIIVGLVGTVILVKYKSKQNSKKLKEEVTKTELQMVEQCREVFAELQTDMTNMKLKLVEHGIPFNSFFSYIFQLIFPQHPKDKMDSHLILTDLQEHEGSEKEFTAAMTKLDNLINNKFFLVSIIRTLDNQPRLKTPDRLNLAGYITFLLLNRLDYFTEIVEMLLSKLTNEVANKKQKDLFQSCNTISERLVINWLAICMYNPIKKSTGSSLYMLFKAIENLLLKWPVDAVTKKTQATLCEDNLLTANVESEELTVKVIMNFGAIQKDCCILDCDTVTQIKYKCINAIYEFEVESEKPSVDKVDIECCKENQRGQMLYDEDSSSQVKDGHRKINTAKDYGISNGDKLYLLSKERENIEESDYVNYGDHSILSTNQIEPMLASADTESCQDEECPEIEKLPIYHLISPSVNTDSKKLMLDLNLNRLLRTKVNLKKYIDAVIKSTVDTLEVPVAIRHFFNLLETTGRKEHIDKQIIESWKINSYFKKFWVRILSQPDLLFDLNEYSKSYIQENMNIIVLAYNDSFSTPQRLDKKSPSHKLLFYQDCNEYRASIDTFFKHSQIFTGVKTEALQSELNKLPYLIDHVTLNRNNMLYQMFEAIDKYDDQVISELDITEETKILKLSERFEEVLTTLRSS